MNKVWSFYLDDGNFKTHFMERFIFKSSSDLHNSFLNVVIYSDKYTS